MSHSANVMIPTGRFCSLFVDFSESHTLKADGSLVSVPFIATQISWKVVSSVVTSRWSDFYCCNTPQLQVQPPFRCAAAPNRSSSISYSWESIEAGDVGVLSSIFHGSSNQIRSIFGWFWNKFCPNSKLPVQQSITQSSLNKHIRESSFDTFTHTWKNPCLYVSIRCLLE